MIELPYTPEMMVESKRLANEMGALNKSITGGAGNRAGILGELALAAYLGATREDKFGFDLNYKGKTIEVKTKRRLVDPYPNYEGSVAVTSEHQKPDYYAFLSLTFTAKRGYKGEENYLGLRKIWFCGLIAYTEFMKKARFLKKGEKDSWNGFKVLTDMRNIHYKDCVWEIEN